MGIILLLLEYINIILYIILIVTTMYSLYPLYIISHYKLVQKYL